MILLPNFDRQFFNKSTTFHSSLKFYNTVEHEINTASGLASQFVT